MFPSIQTDFATQQSDFPIGFTGSNPVMPLPAKSDRKTHAAVTPPLPSIATTYVWGIDYSIVNMAETLDFIDVMVQQRVPGYAITANVNYAMLCESSPRLKDFTDRSQLVLCDGMPILWRSRLNKNPLPERVAGADLIYSLAERSAAKGHRIFLMGGAEEVAQETAKLLRQQFPKLIIAGVECPPFRQLSVDEHEKLCDRIRKAKPDILMVAFGQPKGEFWIEENYLELGVPLSIQLGASFDFIVGKAKRAPQWIQHIGMEWLYRTASDPKRLLPRYIKNSWYLFKAIRSDLLNATK